VTIRKVHIRYEDGQTNSSGYPFATGLTLQSLSMKTTAGGADDGQIKLKVFFVCQQGDLRPVFNIMVCL
jgi:hypothetical protein